MNKKETAKAEAIATLKEWGVIVKDNALLNITYWAAKVLEWTYCDTFPRGVRVGGCGMDMLFHTIDCLSYRMGYGAICQDDRATEPAEKRGQNGEPIKAIGLKYHSI